MILSIASTDIFFLTIMLSADNVSKEEDLLPFLVGVKEEDRLTWEEFGNATLESITKICEYWGLTPPQVSKVQNIWKKHPANQKAPQPQGK